MSRLALYLLGPPRVERDGEALELGASKNVALVAYLAVTGQAYTREALVTLLWPELESSRGRANLRRNLSLLRSALGEAWLDVDREHVGLVACGDLWLDVCVFRSLLDSWRGHGHGPDEVCAQCLEELSEAAALYRGDFLAGFSLRGSVAYDDWQFFQSESLRQEMASALERLVRGHSERGAYAAAVPYARRWVALDPLHEPAHYQLMRSYARAGQRAAALRQYEEYARVLEGELGAKPEIETQVLYERIRDGKQVSLHQSITGGHLPPLRTHNLPAPTTPFVGRARELGELHRLLADSDVRLVTVVGSGGMGKTRLALEVARGALGSYSAGTWLVDLAPLPVGASLPRAVAATLGVFEQPGRPLLEVIADALQTRRLLLVLDNCEHLGTEVALLVDTLLSHCPELTVLATSREPLRVAGEYLYDVPGMEVPALPDLTRTADRRAETAPVRCLLEYDALQLFCQRAAAARPRFTLDEEDGTVVADVCRRLDGMPLAIELAAARLRALSLPELARRLDDRFRLLTGGSRAAQPRQQTLRNTVEWSYDLLGAGERLLFDRLSIFAGSFSLEGAEAVCSGEGIQKEEMLELLARLVDQSLVGRVEGPDGTTRYRLLETLRAYGQERLAQRGETEGVAARHAAYYVSLAEANELVFHEYEREMIDAQRRLDAEADNLAAAVGWALARRQPEMAMRIGGALHFWAMYRARLPQYAEWMRQALAQEGEVAPLYRAKAWGLISCSAWGRWEEAMAAAQAGLASARVAGDPRWIACGLYWAGLYLQATGQREEARACFRECRSLARRCGNAMMAFCAALFLAKYEPLDRRRTLLEGILQKAPYAGRAYGLQFLASAAQLQGDLKSAEAYVRESLAGWTEAGNVGMQGNLSRWLGEIHATCGDYAGAEWMMERGRALARQAGMQVDVVGTTLHLGDLAWRQGEVDTAASRHQEALELAHQHGYPEQAARARLGLALVAAERGEHERAEALCAQAQPDLPAWNDEAHDLALFVRGKAALARGEGAHAVALYRHALARARRDESRPDTVEWVERLAWALLADNQAGEAARLLALAGRERDKMGLALPLVDRPCHEHALETVQDGLGETGLVAAWAEGEALALEAAVEWALAGARRPSNDASS